MAVLYDAPQLAVPPGTGDGGGVGPEKYLQMTLGAPHFAPYTLPANVLVKRIVAISDTDQACTVVATKEDNSEVEIIPVTDFFEDQEETFNPNIFINAATTIDSPDAVPYLYVTVIYQEIRTTPTT